MNKRCIVQVDGAEVEHTLIKQTVLSGLPGFSGPAATFHIYLENHGSRIRANAKWRMIWKMQ